MSSILVIDDDRDLCGLLSGLLSTEAMDVECVHDGPSGAAKAVTGKYDMVLLDVCLPGQSGFEVLGDIRRQNDLPVLMLTGRAETVDRVAGLELGADDYLPKPFDPRELVARVRAQLRRVTRRPRERAVKILCVGDLEMRLGEREAYVEGSAVPLTSMEFALLELLVRNAGEVVRRETVAHDVFEREHQPFDRSIDMLVSKLRRKLGLFADGRERIKSVRGAGYIYCAFEAA